MNDTILQHSTMTESEFCEAVGISRTTAYRLRSKGKLSHFRVGAKVLYGQKHISEFLDASERKAHRARNA